MNSPVDLQEPVTSSLAFPESVGASRDVETGLHGIVLAGVHSWGDCPFDEVVCRPAIPIAAQPLIWHSLRWLREQGVRRASLCANSDTGYLRRCLGDGVSAGLALEYYEDVMPRGPAGSLRDAAIVSDAGRFVVVYGTVVPRVALAEVLRTHEEAGASVTVLATRRNGGPLEPAGVYIFAREVLDHIPAKGYQDIKETLLPKLHAQGIRVMTHVVDDGSIGQVTDTASYLSVCRWTLEASSRAAVLDNGYVPIGEARVHKTAVVSPTARLIGPVTIEAHCRIDNEAIVVGPTSIGEGCTIAARAVVSRSILWNSCHVGIGTIVDDSVLTHHAAIEDGLVVRSTVWMSTVHRRALGAVGSGWPSALQAGSALARSADTFRPTRRPRPHHGPGAVPTGPVVSLTIPRHGGVQATHRPKGEQEHG